MKTRAYSTTSNQQKCEYCYEPLFGKQFYLFPCSHGFHCFCLLRKCHLYLEPSQLNTVRTIEENLKILYNKVKDFDKRARVQQEF
jgi:hypothetical protein